MVAAIGSFGSGSSVGAGKISAQIVALQRQANALMKQARELQKDLRSMAAGDAREAVEKQLIELSRQIQMIQEQIARLQQEAARSGRENSIVSAIEGVKSVPTIRKAASGRSAVGPAVGGRVDTTA